MGGGGRVVRAGAIAASSSIAAVPVWSVVVIAVDVVVIYALCAHGSEGQGCGSRVVGSVGPASADERGPTHPARRSGSRRSPRRTAMPFSTHRSEEWMT